MPKHPKSTKVFGPRGTGFMVTDAAGNQQVVPFADASRIYPTEGGAGVVPPLPSGGAGDTYVLVFNDTTNVYEWVISNTIQGSSVIPLVDGSEPPVLVSDGAGGLIVIDYEP